MALRSVIFDSSGASGGCLHGGASFKVEQAHFAARKKGPEKPPVCRPLKHSMIDYPDLPVLVFVVFLVFFVRFAFFFPFFCAALLSPRISREKSWLSSGDPHFLCAKKAKIGGSGYGCGDLLSVAVCGRLPHEWGKKKTQ